MSKRFKDYYNSRLISIEEAFSFIQSNQRIVTAMAACEPTLFFENLAKHVSSLKDVHVFCANPNKEYDCFSDENMHGSLYLYPMFLTHHIRKAHGHGVVHYVPAHLSQWVSHIHREGPVDIFWGSCTPPDERGFINLGPGACYEPEILRKANKVILEVNEHLPTTSGATHIPMTWVHHFVENHHPLATIGRPEIDDIDRRIAEFVAELVEDRSTIQLGIGSIPNAIGLALRQKKDLGAHTEMINDTIMDLYKEGVITGRHKSIWPGRITGSFALGSRELYEFIDKNPTVLLHPSSVVNDPYRFGRNFKMVSINTAVEIDITGQVCSESIGHRLLSGVGGATDTHLGAQKSEGGRGIIAIRSTTADKQRSKIVFELNPGAKVSISRNDIDTVITEYGIAELRGKSVGNRVKSLAAVAHPKFREELLFEAKKVKYL